MIKKKVLQLIRKRNNELLDKDYKKKSLILKGFPNGLMFEPFSKCNYQCPLCPSGLGILKREYEKMTFKDFKRYLRPFRLTTEYVTLWHFGEPFLNSELDKFVAYCKKYYIKTQISTNGSLLEGELLRRVLIAEVDRLIISLDTYDGNLYPRYRVGGDFDKIISNIKNAIELRDKLKSNTKIIIQYMIMKDNEDIEKMKVHGKSLGVDEVLIKTVGVGTAIKDVKKGEKFFPEDKAYQRYSKISDEDVVTKYNDFSCKYAWKRMLVCSDGTCLVCVRDQNNEYIMGKLSEHTSIIDIWNGEKYQQFRKLLLNNNKDISFCQRCPERLKYKLDPWVDKEEQSQSECRTFKLD